jgi:Bacterial SH3 domain
MEPRPQETRSLPRNRKCGNCRFFEPAPLWRKGWCRNSQLYPPHANHLVDSNTIDCEGGFRSRIYWEPIPEQEQSLEHFLPAPEKSEREPIRPLGAFFKPKDAPPDPDVVYSYTPEEVYAEPVIDISPKNPLPVEQLTPPKDTAGWRFELRKRLPFTENLPLEKIEPKQVLPWVLVGVLVLIMLIVISSNNSKKTDITAQEAANARAIATQNAGLAVYSPTPNLIATTVAVKTTPPNTDKFATVSGLEKAEDTLNLRKDASVNAQVVKSLKQGTKLKVLDGPKLAEGFEWYKVEVDGQTGWVVKKYLTFN